MGAEKSIINSVHSTIIYWGASNHRTPTADVYIDAHTSQITVVAI